MKDTKERSPGAAAPRPENTTVVSEPGGTMSRENSTKVSPDLLREQRVKIAADRPEMGKAFADIMGSETHCFEISRAIRNLLEDPTQCVWVDSHGLADGIMNILYLAGEIYFVPVQVSSIDHYIAPGDVKHVFCKKTGRFEDLSLLNGGLKPHNREPLPWSLLCNGCHKQFREIPADTAKCWLEIRETSEVRP